MSDTSTGSEATEWTPTGRIDEARVRVRWSARPEPAIVARFQALDDLTSTVSDILDRLQIGGGVSGSVLVPRSPGNRLVGSAVTLRNVARTDGLTRAVEERSSRLADVECHNLARPGDVLVIQSVPEPVSNMGAVSGRIGLRQGEVGAIVDGGVRDIDALRRMGFPVWSRSVSPLTGKYRLESVEVNGHVTVSGVDVRPGDLVLADDVGVCVVPTARAEQVVTLAEESVRAERARMKLLDDGVPLSRWVRARDPK